MRVLDSDHCVAIVRAQLDLAGRVTADESLGVTAVSVGELAHGAARSRRAAENLARLDVLLSSLTVLPYDEWAARRFGQLRAQLELAGAAVSDMHLQIASIALDHDSTLVAHNQRHFARLTDIAGLALEDWLD